MPEAASHNWTILGDNAAADALRAAAPFRPAPRPLIIATATTLLPPEAFVDGPAAFDSSNERVVPGLLAFEAIEEIDRALRAGEAGQLYGCYGSHRLSRNATAEQVTDSGLRPLLAVTLQLLDLQVTRVWAQRASLLKADDAWFVTATLDDETVLTLEAMAVTDESAGDELLIEITAAERVLRAEPFRQAVLVERVGSPPAAHPWWEDAAERYLAVVIKASEAAPLHAGTRLRAVWQAIQQSVATGVPITLP